MRTKNVLLLLLVALFSKSSLAQGKTETIIISGEAYSIQNFICDSVVIFNNIEVENRVVYPIFESPATVELRIYINGNACNCGVVKTIKIYEDGVVNTDSYKFHYYNWRHTDTMYEYMGKNNFGQSVGRYIKSKKPTYTSMQLLKILLSNNLLSLKDQKEMDEYFKSTNTEIDTKDCEYCTSSMVVEIKFGKKYRHFLLPNGAANLAEYNSSIIYYKNSAILMNILNY